MANRYDDGTKARVILEWKAGASLKALHRDHGIPEATVRSWVKGMERVDILAPPPAPKTRTLETLAYDLAAESFAAAIAILRLAQDSAWLQRQNASDVAILFGVNADKLYRLLPAFQRDDGPAGRAPPLPGADSQG